MEDDHGRFQEHGRSGSQYRGRKVKSSMIIFHGRNFRGGSESWKMIMEDDHGRSWKIMEDHGRSWKIMEDFQGSESWKILEDHGRSWKIMEDHGRSWKIMEDFQGFGIMEDHGRSWKIMEEQWVSTEVGQMQIFQGRKFSGVQKLGRSWM